VRSHERILVSSDANEGTIWRATRGSLLLGKNGGTKYGTGDDGERAGAVHKCAVARDSKQIVPDFLLHLHMKGSTILICRDMYVLSF
jgi:hypothetical protein